MGLVIFILLTCPLLYPILFWLCSYLKGKGKRREIRESLKKAREMLLARNPEVAEFYIEKAKALQKMER